MGVKQLTQQKVLKTLAARREKVPLELLRVGDFVEFSVPQRGVRVLKVRTIHPRARRLDLVPPERADLPRGSKDLATYAARAGWRGVTVAASQVLGVVVGTPGHRTTVRPGADAWIPFTRARESSSRNGGSSQKKRGSDEPVPAPAVAMPAAPPNPVTAFQAELRAALAQEV